MMRSSIGLKKALAAAAIGLAGMKGVEVQKESERAMQAERAYRQEKRGLSSEEELHYYGQAFRRVRKIFRKNPAAMDSPLFAKVRIVRVPFTRIRDHDKNKFKGAQLRDIRAKNGVGRPRRRGGAA